MGPRRRRVVWSDGAFRELDEAIEYIAQDSRQAAVRLLQRLLDAAQSLSEFAERGRVVFRGQGTCSSCHTGKTFTDINSGRLHAPEETGMDPRYAARTSQKAYRTTPLRALWQHPPYFHDGSAATLVNVVDHYDGVLALGLSAQQKSDLVEYLKSL